MFVLEDVGKTFAFFRPFGACCPSDGILEPYNMHLGEFLDVREHSFFAFVREYSLRIHGRVFLGIHPLTTLVEYMSLGYMN